MSKLSLLRAQLGRAFIDAILTVERQSKVKKSCEPILGQLSAHDTLGLALSDNTLEKQRQSSRRS